MEDDNAVALSPNAHVVGVVSWVGYARVLALAVLLFGLALPATFMYANEIAAAAVLIISALIVGYQLLKLRSIQLYYDEVGVWVTSGVLPWEKGLAGVKWRDMDEATFTQGFWSWLTGSYRVRIGHRVTKASEIVLDNIANGKAAAGALNAYHQNLIRSGAID